MANVAVASAWGILLIVALVFVLRFAVPRSSVLKGREEELGRRRTEYNRINLNGIAPAMGEDIARAAF
ncbi:MAG: hypothetical protein M1314_03505 [Firmicutes bacterium]|nr:hypothetical protein [Bacillota bacterium]